jgi:electron transfer flavoprotein alpha subunit
MTISKIWVIVDRQGDKVAPLSLELLTKAKTLGDTVEGVTYGDGDVLAAQVGAYGGSVLHTVGDIGSALPGPAVASALAARIGSGEGPDALLVPHNYDGRDIAARLSVKIDRPVLTNVVGLSEDLATEHPIFGGSEVLTARFTGEGPGIFVVRTKSFVAEESGGGPATVDTWEVPELGATNGAVVGERHIEESDGPKLDEAAVVVSGGRGLGEAGKYELIEQIAKLLHGEHRRHQQGPGGAHLHHRRPRDRRRYQQGPPATDPGAAGPVLNPSDPDLMHGIRPGARGRGGRCGVRGSGVGARGRRPGGGEPPARRPTAGGTAPR